MKTDWRTLAAAATLPVLIGLLPFAFAGALPLLVLKGLWLVFLAATLAAALRAFLRTTPRQRVAFVALALSAFALRWAFATWGPGDQFYNLVCAFHDRCWDDQYGLAGPAFHQLVWLAVSPGHTTVVATHLVLGAFVPVATFALLDASRLGRGAAWTGALLAAVHPLLVRHAGGANRQALILFVALVALAALVRFVRTQRVSYLLWGAVAAALAAHCRPEVGPFLAAVILGFCQWGAHTTSPTRRGPSRALAWTVSVSSVVVGGLVMWLRLTDTNVAAAWSDIVQVIAPWRGALWMDPGFTPVAMSLLVLPAVVPLPARPRRATLWLLVPLVSIGLSAFIYPTRFNDLTNARYQTLGLIPLVALAGLGLCRLWDRIAASSGRWPRLGLRILLIGALAASVLEPFGRVVAPRLIDHELNFVLSAASRLPDDATVHVVEHRTDAGIKCAVDVLGNTQPALQWREWSDDVSEGAIYYHAAACSWKSRLRTEADVACRSALSRSREQPILTEPMRGLSYEGFALEDPDPSFGFYRVGRAQ